MLAGHAIAGIVILAFMLLRLILRATTKKPRPADLDNVWLNRLRRTVHVAIYVVVFAMVSTGIGTLGMSGAFPVVFGSPACSRRASGTTRRASATCSSRASCWYCSRCTSPARSTTSSCAGTA